MEGLVGRWVKMMGRGGGGGVTGRKWHVRQRQSLFQVGTYKEETSKHNRHNITLIWYGSTNISLSIRLDQHHYWVTGLRSMPDWTHCCLSFYICWGVVCEKYTMRTGWNKVKLSEKSNDYMLYVNFYYTVNCLLLIMNSWTNFRYEYIMIVERRSVTMLITLQRGYEQFPLGFLLSFICIVNFHFPFTVMELDLGWNKGPVTTVSLHHVHLKWYNFNQSIFPNAYENCKYLDT